jgi:enoyl-CoA hydratase/carnithine racemase
VTLAVRTEGAVRFAEIDAPPMNLLGPELVRDLVSLIQEAERDEGAQVLVFMSADPDYFISHVDLTKVDEYRAEAAKLTGEPSIALLFHHLSASRLVTIAQVEGRVRAAGSEFVLACDMRFAARETAVFGQFEPAFGLLPGGGAAQHLTRLMGRGRALEVMLSADDYDAGLAERYGWINRALPAGELGDFVSALAHRIAGFPAAGRRAVKDRVNAIALAPVDDFRRDSDLFGEGVRDPEAQTRIAASMKLRPPDPRRRAGHGGAAGRVDLKPSEAAGPHRHRCGPRRACRYHRERRPRRLPPEAAPSCPSARRCTRACRRDRRP